MLFFITSFGIQAKTYKCTDKAGKVSYGTSPCKDEQTERELKEFKESTTLDPIQLEKDRIAGVAAQQRMDSWQNYKENKFKESCQSGLNEALRRGNATAATLSALSDCANGQKSRGGSLGKLDSRESDSSSEKLRLENEMRAKEAQHRNEIHRMENQQRLKEAFPPPWSR